MKTKFWVICLLVLLASCARDINNIYTGEGEEGNKKEEIKKEDFFDFSTTRNNQIILDYGMKVQTIFSLYDEYPLELVGNTWEFKSIDPIYAGVTDENGKFSSKVTLPSSLGKVWLVSENVLVVSPIELELGAEGLVFNYNDYKAQLATGVRSRAVMDGVPYPDGYATLGEWDKDGIPNYLLPESEKQELPTAFLARCNALADLTRYQVKLLDKFENLRTTGTNDMVITKSTNLIATYFKSSAGWQDMVAYYTYKEGEEIDINTIRKTLLFPRYSSASILGQLVGSQVMLKYWNPDTKKYESEFPAGTHIGWVLLGMGFGNENLGQQYFRYSNPKYNTDNEQRSVLLSDPELDNYFFMAMEDNNDMRFNDVQFAITASTVSSVEPTPSIPDEVGKDETSYVVKGSLAFEDNWPKQGDYDMNDVVIYYSSTMVIGTDSKNQGKLLRTTITFTPVNNGAIFTNGFGFQLDEVAKNSISSVMISREGTIISESFDPEYDKPVVILFSDIKSVLNKPMKVVITYNYGGVVNDEKVLPPYNPFIFVNTPSHEVHLPGYKPTNKADDTLRGTENDLRKDNAGNEMYYISKDNMPFAIHISGSEFKWPPESMPITEFYPQFEPWRKSFGGENKDWYLHPKGQ
jgi:LruC domain-containing protein